MHTAHPNIQFHIMVAKISQSNRKDPSFIWKQMLSRKDSMKSICCGLNIGKEFVDSILELDCHHKETYVSMGPGN